MVALAIAVSAGIIAIVRELTVVESQENENTDARKRLTADISVLQRDLETMKAIQTQHLHEDDAKHLNFEVLRSRVDHLEARAESLFKSQDDLRSNLMRDEQDDHASLDALQRRLEALADKLNGDLKR